MEKNKLYKVNKWNKPAFMREGNVYWPGGEVQIAPAFTLDYNKINQRLGALGANVTNSLNSGTATAQPTKGNTLTGILGAVGGTAGNMLGNAIGGGYSTGGVGEGVAGVGNTIGGLVSTVNPLVGTAIQFGSGLIGGAINRGWGVKENKENIEAIKQNTANARMTGNALAGVTDSKGFFDTAGEMTTGSGFSAGDLYKDGWFTSKGTRQGNALINKENNALAFQRHGMVTGAENVDSIMDDNVFSNFAAFGGYVPTIGAGTEDMPAINFGMWQDWLTGLNKRRKQASDNREANDYTNIGMGMRYDFGGDMQTNSADFSSGLVHVDAGGTHEESPYDGVQMGVDPEGTPNLVEEGEVIWNDYVFSNRIELDEEAKKIFHFPKKTKLTYADAAKRLEKEISERPNDPISKAGFKVQMEKLEEQQERQKQEMEAERAKAAFEALSPEEQVEAVTLLQQREQAAQEQAMVAEQANMPGTEPGVGVGPNQEEMLLAQQQEQPEIVEGQPAMAAYGGNLYDGGGALDLALEWLKRNNDLQLSDTELHSVATAMSNYIKSNYPNTDPRALSMGNVYGKFFKGWSTTPDAYGQNYRDMRSLGISRATALKMLKARKKWSSDNSANNKQWDAIASKWEPQAKKATVKTSAPTQQAVSTTMPSSNRSIFTSASDIVNNAVARAGAQQQAAPVIQPQATIDRNAAIDAAVNNWWNQHRVDAEREIAARKATAQSAPTETATVERGVAPATPAARRAAATNTTEKGVNVGEWNIEHPWDKYGLPSAEQYVLSQFAGYDALSDEEKAQRAAETVQGLNAIQESYWNNVVPLIGKRRQERNEGVGQHQQAYHQMTGNVGFRQTDDDGNLLLDTDLTKPVGYYTGDNLKDGWVDFRSGPQTEQRHFGATGDKVNGLVDTLKQMGIDYSPYNAWTIGEGDNARQLYRASLIGAPNTEDEDKSFAEKYPMIARPAETTDKKQSVAGQYGAPWAPESASTATSAGATGSVTSTNKKNENNNLVPVLNNEKLRYARVLAPALGLGLWAAGVGKPNTSVFDSVLEGYDRSEIGQMEPRYIGNYLRYSPMDIWYEQNRLNANSRATDRAIANSGANQGSKIAGMLANAYNNQIASGDLYRKALEYNDTKRHQVADFNRATDMFNAQAYNQAQQFNASARNADRGLRAQLGMQAAAQKADMDAGWYQSLYGNLGSLANAVASIGDENKRDNMINWMLSKGVLGAVDPDDEYLQGRVKRANTGAHGGKLKKKKKRGLTY